MMVYSVSAKLQGGGGLHHTVIGQQGDTLSRQLQS